MVRIIFLFLLLVCIRGSAQSISPISVNCGGAQTKNSFSLDYSIGESASIAFFQNSSQVSLSTGFHQTFTPLITGIINQIFEEGDGLTLSPNPATDYVRLNGALSKPGFYEFHLIDIQGQILETYLSTYYINYLEKKINISHLQGGTYFVRLIYSSPDGFKQAISFKFIKIN